MPDLVGPARTLKQAAARMVGALRRRREAVLELEPAAGTSSTTLEMSGSAVKTVAASAPIEQRVAFLMGEAERNQGRLNELESGARGMEKQRERDLSELRDELAAQRQEIAGLVEREIDESDERYVRWRRGGTVLLVIGLAFQAAGSLI